MTGIERESGHAAERESLDDAARRAHQDAVVRRAVLLAWDGVPHYRDRMEGAGITPGDVRGLADLPLVPVTPKAATRGAPSVGTGAIPLKEARRIYVSPGPHFYASARRTDPPPERGRTPLALAFHAMGFRPGDIVLNTFSYHLTPGGFGFDEQLGAAGCAVIPAGPENRDLQAQILAKLAVTGYVGTPAFLRLLCEKAGELGIDPRRDWSLAVAFVTAERLTEAAREDLQERTGARVRQIYGSADGLLPAYECWHASGMHLDPDQILEVLDPQTRTPVAMGETGECVATVAAPNRPLLRFANEDLVALRDDPCPCGRTGPRIARFVGRAGEGAKVRGMFVYPSQIAEVMARHPSVARWRAIVAAGPDGSDDFRVEVVASSGAGVPAERIAEDLKGLVRVRAHVEIVEGIASDASAMEDRRGDGR